jgi:hypothetical protein
MYQTYPVLWPSLIYDTTQIHKYYISENPSAGPLFVMARTSRSSLGSEFFCERAESRSATLKEDTTRSVALP